MSSVSGQAHAGFRHALSPSLASGDSDRMSGALSLLKPPGMTSHDVVAFLRRLLGVRRIGHCGTLDPLAAGVLPLCIGRATFASDYLSALPKAYRAEFDFTVETDTLDFGGSPSSETGRREPGGLSPGEIQAVLSRFVGRRPQIPPMYAAVKVSGRKLYEYARAGQQVERKPRDAEAAEITLVRYDAKRMRAVVDVRCSKGFYVRSLCRDVGAALGCPASLSFLLRTRSCGFCLDDAYTLEAVERMHAAGGLANAVVPIGDALGKAFAAIRLSAPDAKRFSNGNTVEIGFDAIASEAAATDRERLTKGSIFRAYRSAEFIGIASVEPASPDAGRLRVRPIKVYAAGSACAER